MRASIHTGGIAFLLTTIFGGAAGIVASIGIFIEYEYYDVRGIVAVLLALGHVPGAVSFCGALGAVISLMLFGQTLARCFHLMFTIALAWAIVIAVYLLFPWLTERFYPRWYQNEPDWILTLAFPAALVGLAIGKNLARSSTGFSSRARKCAIVGALTVALIFVVASFGAYGLQLPGWPQEINVIALLAITDGAYVGALLAADRVQERGFGVMPAMPISKSEDFARRVTKL